MFHKRVLMEIFGDERDEAIGEGRKLHNDELYDLDCSPNGDKTKNEMGGAHDTYEEDEWWIWSCGRET